MALVWRRIEVMNVRFACAGLREIFWLTWRIVVEGMPGSRKSRVGVMGLW